MTHAVLLVTSFLLCVLSTVALADDVTDSANLLELRQEAELAYSDRDAEYAEALFLQIAEESPDDPEAWFGLSRAYEWSGQLEKAIDAAERVQQLGYVDRSYLSYRLASLNALAGHRDAAMQWLERALREGYEERPEIQSDEAFVSLRSDPQFIKLAGMLPSDKSDRIAGLRFDIDYVVEEAQRMHASPDRPAFSSYFDQEARSLKASIPEMSDPEVLAGIMYLLAILSDGHTGIYGPDPDTPLRMSPNTLPLKFYWFAEGVFIVDGIGSASEFAGSRVLRFGDLSAEETLQRLSKYRGVDNSMTWKWMGPQFYLGFMQMLEVVGATDSTDSITLTLEDMDGDVSQHQFEGGFNQVQRKLRPSPASDGAIPMYLTNVDVQYWMESLPDKDAIYFQFNQVRDREDQTIAEFASELAERLEKEHATTLVVDVRHNNGGNNSLVRPLIRTLIGFEQASPTHRIYVITGRNTFSAAQNFVTRVEQWTNAIFVGEPSASRPNFVGEETNLLLPYSRLRGSISTRYWQDSNPGDDRAWITPAVPVVPTAADYFAGRDAALELVADLISSARDR
jgi:tetratricopeptide (TPR) repeat protein